MDYITVAWQTTRQYKTQNSRTLKSATRNYSKMFGLSLEGYETAKKLVEEKRTKGYNAYIIFEENVIKKLSHGVGHEESN